LKTERRHVALFRNDLGGESFLFQNPRELIIAEEPGELLPGLERAEQAQRDGRWVAGYISYEAGYLLDPALTDLLPSQRDCPLLVLGAFDAPDTTYEPQADVICPPRLWNAQATWDMEAYRPRFTQLHQQLERGDCFQGNLTFPIHAKWEGDPIALFHLLVKTQPVRHSAFIDLHGPTILSRSPELFFSVSRSGWIETSPMKGTMPRGSTPEEDKAHREHLRRDPKIQAENRMIVDLLRNDMSRISEAGSVHVPDLFEVQTYPTLHQMVSRIRAKLRPNTGLTEIMHALFPCGSITGAPKISAMRILRQLEDTPRGVYCGAIGWAAPDGTMKFNVAIRTMSLFADGRATFNVGGGVILDSTAEAEYDECLLKAQFIARHCDGGIKRSPARYPPEVLSGVVHPA